MRAFVVSVNGRRLCTAGIGPDGVLSSIVTWSGHNRSGGFHMSVGGLDSRTEEYKNWPVMEIGVGDDILTRIIETETIDEPETSQTRKAIQDKARSLTGENPAVHKPIDARIFMLDPGSGAWGEGEFYGFLTLPRIGEFLELMVDGFKAMVKVVMIAHFPDRSSLVHLYAKVEGELDDCLRRLAETV